MRSMMMGVVAGVLGLALVVDSAVAQGPGNRRGMGRGMGNRMCTGMGPGASAGGWWTRVTPKTPEQKAFVARVTDLHNRIRTANLELATLKAQNAPSAQIAAKTQYIRTLQAQLQKDTQANQRLLSELGLPAGAGVCDGTGPKGNGGPGQGFGRGSGRGLRDGTGPNPNCPLKTK